MAPNYKAELVGVFGSPVAENPTGVMQEAHTALGLNWRYLTMEVHHEDLAAAMQGVRAMNFAGINCTIPHKVAVLQYLDDVSPDARLMGAVNMQEHRPGRHRRITHAAGYRGIIEFVGSGKYHPILPLIRPSGAPVRSHRTTQRMLQPTARTGSRAALPGNVLRPANHAGDTTASHDWLIMSGVGCPVPGQSTASTALGRAMARWPSSSVTTFAATKSSILPPYQPRRVHPRPPASQAAYFYVVTAMDAETFGHHIAGWETEFLDETLGLLHPPGPARGAPRADGLPQHRRRPVPGRRGRPPLA